MFVRCYCGKRFRAAEKHAGSSMRCYLCGRVLVVPAQPKVAPLAPGTAISAGRPVPSRPSIPRLVVGANRSRDAGEYEWRPVPSAAERGRAWRDRAAAIAVILGGLGLCAFLLIAVGVPSLR